MEARRLLAGDLGSISGNIFTDTTDDGFGVGTDTAITAATVFLYRDGGNATNDSAGGAGTAGGDDTFIGSIASDGSGNYSFDDLADGTYFVEQAAVAGQLQRPVETIKTVTITPAESVGVQIANLDNFDTTGQTLQANSATPSVNEALSTAVGEALGGERDILVNYLSGVNNVDVTVNAGSVGLLSVSTGSGTTGNAIISYDGPDGDATTLDHGTVLGDLTASGGTAFRFLAGSEAGNTITIDVFSGSGNHSTTTVPLPIVAGAVATEDMILRFADFTVGSGAGADFTSVTAIRLQIDMAAATDAQFDFSELVAPFVNTQNFANLNPMSIGNQVFADANDNGVLDGAEVGIPGVSVELYSDTNGNGSFDSGTDIQVGTATTTDATGNYSFGNLLPGEYIAVIPISEFATGADPLFGFASSNNGGAFEPAPDPDTIVNDADDNGTLIAGVGVATAAITLAAGTEPTNDGDTDTNTDNTIDFGFAPQIDLEVTKSAGAVTTVSAGQQLTYTITVSNLGDSTANNVLVVDNLPDLSPDGLTIVSVVSASGNGTVTQTGLAAGEIEVAYTSLAPAATDTITVVVGIPATAAVAAVITNAVTVSGDGVETDLTNNDATVDVAVDRVAALQITKTDTPDPASVGATLTYEILVTNNGPSTATNVVIADTLPAGLDFVSVTESTGTGTASEVGGVITANVPTLAVNGAVTVTVTATIQAGFAGSTIPNTATANADEATEVTANASTTVNPQIDLAITKSDSVDPINRGAQLTYTLDIVNNGPSAATNVVVVDTLPAGVAFVSAAGAAVTAPTGGSSDVTFTVGALASGATAQLTIVVDVLQSAAATFTNTAIVRSTESIGGFDTDVTNNTTTETTATQRTVDLAITKTDSADPVAPGETFTYTIIATNNGPSDAVLVNVADNIPDGIRITSATSTVGTVVVPASAQDTTAANNDDLTLAVGNLAQGGSVTITVNATALPATRGTLTNVATVSTTDTATVESDSTNNSATETTTLVPEIDLTVTKTDSVDPAIAGNSLTYTIVVTNDGPSTATNVNLTDTLPSGVTFTSVTSSQGTASQAGGVVSAAIGTLAPAATATITLIVGINAGTVGTVTNTASVTGAEAESDSTNNSATATTTVNANVDLSVTKADSTDPVGAGGSLSYTIIVTNNGPSTATNVVMTDNLPTALTFSSGTSTTGTVTNVGNAVTAAIGTLAPGASATVTVNTAVSTTATGTITNTATVTSTETDTNPANNSITEPTSLAVPGSIAGRVYLDANANGVLDAGTEEGISGVLITLTGTDILGNAVTATRTTDATGNYLFDNLMPGTYTLTQTQPQGFRDGQANVGSLNSGTAGANVIATITLPNDTDATAYNFGELQSSLSKRRLLASSEAGD